MNMLGLDLTPGSMLQPPGSAEHNLIEAVADYVIDTGTQWDLGTFGAIAEFMRDEGEPAAIQRGDHMLAISTARGALHLDENPDARLLAYETVGRRAGLWRHGVAVTLPKDACAMHRRRVVTEIGPDDLAIRPEDRGGILFDLGLGILQTDVCVRTRDAVLIAALRASEGRSLFEHGNPALLTVLQMGPHRVFVSRIGRVEVFQPIPPATGKSPDGPHTHILPKLLRTGRTHAATAPIPEGWVPIAHFYPPHPLRDIQDAPRPFAREHFDAFSDLYSRFGIASLVSLQRQVIAAIRCGTPPASIAIPPSKFARACVRVTLRKLKAAGETSPMLDHWFACHDRSTTEDGEDELVHAC